MHTFLQFENSKHKMDKFRGTDHKYQIPGRKTASILYLPQK